MDPICPPLLKRVHQHCESSSQMVFMDSTETTDCKESRMFILLTHGDCGGLPLGVIITSSENADLIQMGFQLLKDMVGSTIFGGYPEGPTIFLTDDSSAEQSAINAMWPRSRCISRIFHVLQSVWKWLVKTKNSIPQEQRNTYFQDFKSTMFSKSMGDCFKKYEVAKSNIIHENYRNCFEGYWQRKELWALSYRNDLLTEGNENILSESVMRIIKDKICNRVKAFNIVQLVDFIVTKFVTYYETRLMDTANNCLWKNILEKTIELPPPGVIERIQVLNDSIIFVPSESLEDLFYIVNIDGLTCTCLSGNTGEICQHIDWACISAYAEKYNMTISNINKRKMFYYIGTGCNPPKNWLLPLFDNIDKSDTQDTGDTSDAEVFEMCTTTLEESGVIKSEEFIKSEEDIKERGQIVLNKMLVKMTSHIEKSPREIVAALEKMYENMEKLRTIAGAASAYSNFALEREYRRRNAFSRMPMKPAISKRKAFLSRKKLNVAGSPRNRAYLRKTLKENKEKDKQV